MKVYFRTWQPFDIKEIKEALFVIGELSGECFNCHNMGIALGEKICPFCNAEFKFIAFRRKVNHAVIDRFRAKYPNATLIEFNDFKKSVERDRARKILDI